MCEKYARLMISASMHGRTAGALGLSWRPAKQKTLHLVDLSTHFRMRASREEVREAWIKASMCLKAARV
jgi:acetylornithine/succinyldiaminopimelate/putrescine aminotransferase